MTNFTTAVSGDLPAVDLDGAIDTTGVTTTDVIAAVVVLIATLIVATVIRHVTREQLGRPETSARQFARLAGTAARWIVWFIGGAWAISLLGADMGWFTITIVLVVALFVLVMRPLLEKYAAGVALATAGSFDVGDEIGVKEYEGEVLEITGRSTALRLRNGRRVHVPNNEMIDHDDVVFTTEQKRRTEIELEVGGHHTVESVERVILDALGAVAVIASEPAPRVRARGFGEASARLSVRVWHDSDLASASEALDQAVRAIARGLEGAGMELANPSLEVVLPDRGMVS